MGREVHVVVLILLSIFEVWMCYQVLYRTVLDKKYLRTWQKVLIWMNILGVGTLLGVNRRLLFYSHYMFYFSVIMTALCVWSVAKKDIVIKVDIVFLYYLCLAFQDFFFAFMSMNFLGEAFFSSIYKFPEEEIQVVIFLVPRVCLMILLFKWRERVEGIQGYKKSLFLLCIILLALLRGYQITLANMAYGMKEIRGLAAAISMLVILFIIVGSFSLLHYFRILKKENEMLAIREELSRKHLEETEKLMEKNRIQIHDMKKHLLIMVQYGKEREWESLLHYLNELSSEMSQGEKISWTHVKILDIVINQAKEKAEKLGIDFRIEETVIGTLPFTDTEVCALFGNILDNAVEACCKMKQEQKWIEIKFFRKSKMLYVEIANSIEQKPLEKNGKLISDKPREMMHGYGLKSVYKIVRKYNGDFSYKIDMKEFRVKIAFFLLN